jgi:hypothetical protein
MVRGVGGTTSVSSGFWAMIGPRWRAVRIGGDGAPPSMGFSRGRCRADGAGRWRDDLRVVRFLGNVIGLRWRAEEVGGDGAPPSSWIFEGALPRRWRGALEGRPPCRPGFGHCDRAALARGGSGRRRSTALQGVFEGRCRAIALWGNLARGQSKPNEKETLMNKRSNNDDATPTPASQKPRGKK